MFDCITPEWLVSCCDLTNIQVSCDRNKLQGLFYPVAHTFHKRPSGRLWQHVLVLSAKGQAGKECPLPGLGLDPKGRVKGQAEAEVEILQVHLAEIKVPSVWCGENYWVGSHKEKWKDDTLWSDR